jgi:hypothetical protein
MEELRLQLLNVVAMVLPRRTGWKATGVSATLERFRDGAIMLKSSDSCPRATAEADMSCSVFRFVILSRILVVK